MPAPNVFVSYSHDSEAHMAWVARLAADLRSRGLDVTLDQWDLELGADIVSFMERSVASADRVVLVCTRRYVDRANRGDGGVGYERLIVSAELAGRIDTTKFVPIVREMGEEQSTPRYLGARRYLDFTEDATYEARLDDLARNLHGLGSLSKPPLGANPYASVAPDDAAQARIAGPSGLVGSGAQVLDDSWFADRAGESDAGIARAQARGAMQVRFALHEPVRKSQIELLEAVRASTIRTFGWPFAVMLENREEYRPRPVEYGLRAEVRIDGKGMSGEASYDFWAARANGDFFAQQSYFEDQRRPGWLFFNTRIVRITEAFLFAANYYERLGISRDAKSSFRVRHSGLRDRFLGSSNSNRDVLPRQTTADAAEAQISEEVGLLRENVIDNVIKTAAPLFLLFDYAQFQRSVYEDIILNFMKGQVT